MVSAQSSEGTDLRPGRYDDLGALTDSETDRAADLQDRVAQLTQEVRDLTAQVDDDDVRRYQDQVEALEEPAGLTKRTGPGVVVTLSDAPDEVVDAATGDKNLLVVHQQDIQAVVNAMWEGGAACGGAPGPAHGQHHRHQVRGQLGGDPGRALPAALRHRRGR